MRRSVTKMGELLERWTFTFLPAPAHPEANQLDRHNQSLIRKLTVVLRTLLFFVRLQPAHGLCRGPNAPARFHLFRVEAWPPTSRPSTTLELLSQDFVTLQSTVGTLRLSVSQRKDLKSLTSAGPLPLQGVAAISSQTEKIEMEEGDAERCAVKMAHQDGIGLEWSLDQIGCFLQQQLDVVA
ncbi:C3H1-type domain-containing protein [Durusdinium trenchii]|uniref:C3H1-type domain-containing protein n=1 Tax=Durusdinium trenchii TaxID=1381693 RepID=A0ABP0K3I5_9DINO